MAYRKSSDDLRKKPSKKKVQYIKANRSSYSRPQSENSTSNSNEIYSHSKEKSFDLNSINRKSKKQRSRKKLIITNVLLSILLVLSTVSFAATSMLDASFKKTDIDVNEDGNFKNIIVSDNANVAYFLVCGVDLSENLTDVIMVACYDLANNSVNILQIPRDTYVGTTSTGKINAVYGSSREGESHIKALMRSINDNFGIPIDHYITITIEGTEDIINALGGVDITLTRDFNLVDDSRKPEQKKTIYKGKVHLDGQWATALIRHRASLNGDTGRIKNQRSVYAAIMKKIINISFSNLTSVATNCMDDISTDLSLGQILGYAQKAHKLSLKKVNIMSVPGYSTMVGSQSCWICRKQDTVDMINEYFMPYEKKVLTANDIDIPGGQQDDHSYDSELQGGSFEDFDNDNTTKTTSSNNQ